MKQINKRRVSSNTLNSWLNWIKVSSSVDRKVSPIHSRWEGREGRGKERRRAKLQLRGVTLKLHLLLYTNVIKYKRDSLKFPTINRRYMFLKSNKFSNRGRGRGRGREREREGEEEGGRGRWREGLQKMRGEERRRKKKERYNKQQLSPWKPKSQTPPTPTVYEPIQVNKEEKGEREEQ